VPPLRPQPVVATFQPAGLVKAYAEMSIRGPCVGPQPVLNASDAIAGTVCDETLASLRPRPPGSGFASWILRLDRLPVGYSTGVYKGRRYGVTVTRTRDRGRTSLLARELGGADLVSFNLYRTAAGRVHFKPCEMSAEKVTDFVLGFDLEAVASPGPGDD